MAIDSAAWGRGEPAYPGISFVLKAFSIIKVWFDEVEKRSKSLRCWERKVEVVHVQCGEPTELAGTCYMYQSLQCHCWKRTSSGVHRFSSTCGKRFL